MATRMNQTSEPTSRRRHRSLSVSAAARRSTQLNSKDDVPSQFSNKRENPLFWTSSIGNDNRSPPFRVFNSENAPSDTSSKVKTAGYSGRPVTRNSGLDKPKEAGCSLKRVRCRSVSRGRYGDCAYESEKKEYMKSTAQGSIRNLSDTNAKKPSSCKNGAYSFSPMKIRQTQTPDPADESDSNLHISDWDERISSGRVSEVEEKTIRAVCEQMKAIRVGTSGALSTANFADVDSEMVTPDAVERVVDIRSEYARKLEESQERARKLRADLLVEEHRERELSRILKELLPDPKISAVKRCHRKRTSNERKRMSKCLTEDAMAYFDECVSISTFDSSDFSATEDQPLNSIAASYLIGGSASVMQNVSSFNSVSKDHRQGLNGRHFMDTCTQPTFTVNSSSLEPAIDLASQGGEDGSCGWKSQFSNAKLQEKLKNSFKDFEKVLDKDDIMADNYIRSKYFDLEEHNSVCCREGLLFERVVINTRMRSGSLHLCGGGFSLSFSPFHSLI